MILIGIYFKYFQAKKDLYETESNKLKIEFNE